jgi:uncharacterized protein
VKINLNKLEEPRRFDESLVVEPDRIDSDQVTAPIRVRLEGEVRPFDGHFTILGSSSSEGALACARCLDDVAWKHREDFSIRYRQPAPEALDAEIGLENDDLDVAFMSDGELDLYELAAEQVLLALPMRSLCSSNCAGLCPQCGANRNRAGACSCEPEVDPRWSALGDLSSDRNTS